MSDATISLVREKLGEVPVRLLRATVAGLAISISGLASLIAVGAEIPGMSQRVTQQLSGLPFASLALLIAVVAAELAIPRLPRLGAIATGTTAAIALVALLVRLSESIESLEVGTVAQTLADSGVAKWAVLLLSVVGFATYLVLLTSFASDKTRSKRRQPTRPFDPLPSQDAFVHAALERCREQETAGFKLIPITGRWGDGKSYLVSLLETELRRQSIDSIRVNVWQSETDLRFYQSLLRDVYGTDTFTRKFGWLRKPIGVALSSVMRWKPTNLKFGVFSSSAEITMRHEPPALPYAQALKRDLQARYRSDRPTLAIIVDEIDRATPIAAQTALTVLRRAFDEPGVVVVLAYAEAHVHFNCFNPARGMLDDIRGSMMSVIDQERRLELASSTSPQLSADSGVVQSVAHIMGGGLSEWIQEAPDGRELAGLPRVADRVQVELGIRTDLELLGRYLAWSPARQHSLQQRAAEKLLHGPKLSVPPVTPDDVARLLRCTDAFREIAPLVEVESESDQGPGGVGRQDVLIRAAIRSLAETVFSEDHVPPPIRHLKNTIDELMPTLVRDRASRSAGVVTLVELAVIVAGLYVMAQYKAAGSGE